MEPNLGCIQVLATLLSVVINIVLWLVLHSSTATGLVSRKGTFTCPHDFGIYHRKCILTTVMDFLHLTFVCRSCRTAIRIKQHRMFVPVGINLYSGEDGVNLHLGNSHHIFTRICQRWSETIFGAMLNKDCLYFDMFLYTVERVMKFRSEDSGIFNHSTTEISKNGFHSVPHTLNCRIAVPSPCL